MAQYLLKVLSTGSTDLIITSLLTWVFIQVHLLLLIQATLSAVQHLPTKLRYNVEQNPTT